MKMASLSRTRKLCSTQRLAGTVEQRGHEEVIEKSARPQRMKSRGQG